MRIKKVIFLIVFFVFLCMIPSICAAATDQEVGEAIARYAVSMIQPDVASQTIYDWRGAGSNADYNGTSPRAKAYLGIKSNGIAEASRGRTREYRYDRLGMDCVGFVTFVIHHATGLGGNTWTYFAWPQNYNSSNTKEVAKSQVAVGDMICSSSHIEIVVAVRSSTSVDTIHIIPGNGNDWQASRNNNRNIRSDDKIYRVKSELANTANFNPSFDGSTVSLDYSGIDNQFVGRDVNQIEGIEEDEIVYMGLPGTGIYQQEEIRGFSWILRSLLDIIDWIVGFISLIVVRSTIIGWTSIVENMVNEVMNIFTNITTNMTVEDIVFNRVPILDINVFNFATAGGQAIEEESLIYILRQNVANWYYIVRNVTIVGLLVTLLYIGIQMAISTIAEKKAKYQKMLINWFVSFIIVFFIHYVMIVIVELNETLINLVRMPNLSEISLYDAVRAQAYDIRASTGFPATIMYMCLVYLLCKYLIVYLKRMVTVYILTMMAPVVAVGYSIDKIKDNKSQSLSNWVREYSFNVMVQSLHALLYSIFGVMAFQTMNSSLIGVILAFFILNYMLKAEENVRNIFGFKPATLKSVMENTMNAAVGVTLAARSAKASFNMLSWEVKKGYKIATKKKKAELKDIKIETSTSKLLADAKALYKGYKPAVKEVGKEIGNTLVGVGAIAISIPTTVMSPTAGGTLLVTGVNKYNQGYAKKRPKPIRGYNKDGIESGSESKKQEERKRIRSSKQKRASGDKNKDKVAKGLKQELKNNTKELDTSELIVEEEIDKDNTLFIDTEETPKQKRYTSQKGKSPRKMRRAVTKGAEFGMNVVTAGQYSRFKNSAKHHHKKVTENNQKFDNIEVALTNASNAEEQLIEEIENIGEMTPGHFKYLLDATVVISSDDVRDGVMESFSVTGELSIETLDDVRDRINSHSTGRLHINHDLQRNTREIVRHRISVETNREVIKIDDGEVDEYFDKLRLKEKLSMIDMATTLEGSTSKRLVNQKDVRQAIAEDYIKDQNGDIGRLEDILKQIGEKEKLNLNESSIDRMMKTARNDIAKKEIARIERARKRTKTQEDDIELTEVEEETRRIDPPDIERRKHRQPEERLHTDGMPKKLNLRDIKQKNIEEAFNNMSVEERTNIVMNAINEGFAKVKQEKRTLKFKEFTPQLEMMRMSEKIAKQEKFKEYSARKSAKEIIKQIKDEKKENSGKEKEKK